MKTWLVKDARAHFGDVLASARAGEPQRITNRGRDAVILVSEAEWERRGSAEPASRPRKLPSQLLAESPLTAEEWQELLPKRRPFRSSVTFDD
jgi:prevent-host-death family protein